MIWTVRAGRRNGAWSVVGGAGTGSTMSCMNQPSWKTVLPVTAPAASALPVTASWKILVMSETNYRSRTSLTRSLTERAVRWLSYQRAETGIDRVRARALAALLSQVDAEAYERGCEGKHDLAMMVNQLVCARPESRLALHAKAIELVRRLGFASPLRDSPPPGLEQEG